MMKGREESLRFVGFKLVAVVFPALVTVTTVTLILSHWCLYLFPRPPRLPCFCFHDFSLSLQ